MDLTTAVSLIRDGVTDGTPQTWADLGAGKGMFSEGLASVLASGRIIAVDKDQVALRTIALENPSVTLELVVGDISQTTFPDGSLDGIVMANSIHYIRDKGDCLRRLTPALKATGRIIVIEYDMDTPNPYVPYPVSFASLQGVAKRAGFGRCVRLAAARSVYQKRGIYSALMTL